MTTIPPVGSEFSVDAIWLSPVQKDQVTNRFVSRVYYQDRNNLIVETPPLIVDGFELLVDGNGEGVHKILVRSHLQQANPEFRQLIQRIDRQLLRFSMFRSGRNFVPCLSLDEAYLFYIPVYNKEVNVLVTKEKEPRSIQDVKRGTVCRLTLLLSHVEAENEVFLPIWNIIEMKLT